MKNKALPDAERVFARILQTLGAKNAPEAAQILGLSKQSVYDWKKSVPSLENLLRISRSGNASLHWLLTGEGAREVERLFDLEYSVERHPDNWLDVMKEWYEFDEQQMPEETVGLRLMGGWRSYPTVADKAGAIRELRTLWDLAKTRTDHET
ncbi:MAG TPA: helix-turn-helix domain-containing protein [Pyrinomonadaceae bacterium]|nr:helix-turn-helix domain-containing protein [Pyrinomonadaceae bacterium]